jgi:hypothetical protein
MDMPKAPIPSAGRFPEPFMGAVAMQRLFLTIILDPGTTIDAKARLASVYTQLEEMKRRIIGKPLPKPVDTTLKQRKTIAAASFIMPSLADASSVSSLVPEPEPVRVIDKP